MFLQRRAMGKRTILFSEWLITVNLIKVQFWSYLDLIKVKFDGYKDFLWKVNFTN